VLRERASLRYRGLFVLPVALTLLGWAVFMSVEGLWPLFRTHGYMTLTMVVARSSRA